MLVEEAQALIELGAPLGEGPVEVDLFSQLQGSHKLRAIGASSLDAKDAARATGGVGALYHAHIDRWIGSLGELHLQLLVNGLQHHRTFQHLDQGGHVDAGGVAGDLRNRQTFLAATASTSATGDGVVDQQQEGAAVFRSGDPFEDGEAAAGSEQN